MSTFSLQTEIEEHIKRNPLEGGDIYDIQQRRDCLCKAVKQYGDRFELRDDSKLAWKYCNNTDAQTSSFWNNDSGNTDLSKIALELVAMQLLYATPWRTDQGDKSFKDVQEEKLRALANWAKATHPSLPWKRVWAVIKDSGTPIVKLLACKNILLSKK